MQDVCFAKEVLNLQAIFSSTAIFSQILLMYVLPLVFYCAR